MSAETLTLVLLTASQAEQYLRIPAGTVRSWASRGVLRDLDCDPAGRPRYSVADLLARRD